MADAPESPHRTGESKPAGRFPEPPLDLDVRAAAGPYPRPRPPRGSLRKTWLAAAGAAMILALTWVLFSSYEDSPPPEDSELIPATASLTDSADRPAEENLGFAPVSTPPEDQLESPREPAAEPPAPAAASAKPADKPAPATASAKPADKPAPATASAKPADKPAPAATASAKPADKPTEAAEQPAAAPPTEKPGSAEISDKWVVNVSSTPDAAESLRFLSTLMGQDVGGRVYASEANLEGRIQHRIRVGFFDTKEEAEAVGLKIKERYRLYATPWAVRPSKEEESKYGGGR